MIFFFIIKNEKQIQSFFGAEGAEKDALNRQKYVLNLDFCL